MNVSEAAVAYALAVYETKTREVRNSKEEANSEDFVEKAAIILLKRISERYITLESCIVIICLQKRCMLLIFPVQITYIFQ